MLCWIIEVVFIYTRQLQIMSFYASLAGEPDLPLEAIKEYLEQNVFEDLEGYVPRVEEDFDDNKRSDLFVQTSDYNVFLTEDGLQFHGINPETIGHEWSPESEQVWKYLDERYLEGEGELEEMLDWK